VRVFGRDADTASAGSVTAELALALPSLLLILTIGIWLQSAVALQARCLDAARAGARAIARGDADGVVRARVAAVLPAGSSVAIEHSGGNVTVQVRAAARPPAGLASFVGAPTVTGLAAAADEAATVAP
jgi:hypothetical protein